MRHKEEIYEGVHQSIITQELFDQVQSIFRANRKDHALGKKSRNPSLLTGMIIDPDGKPMTPAHATKGSKRYRYYVTRSSPGDRSTKWRMPAGEIERLVVDAVAQNLECAGAIGNETAQKLSDHLDNRREIVSALPNLSIKKQREILMELQARVQIKAETVELVFLPADQDNPTSISIDAKLVSKGSDLKLAIPPGIGKSKREPDPVLLRLVAHAFAAQDLLVREEPSAMISKYSQRHIQQLARISYLAPDIVSAIVNGTQPVDLTGRKILRIGNVPLGFN
ncbi:MAG: hypothetical protein Pars92KO_03610 [Parasphingorhabdus sp.]